MESVIKIHPVPLVLAIGRGPMQIQILRLSDGLLSSATREVIDNSHKLLPFLVDEVPLLSDLPLDLGEPGACESRKICSCFLKKVTDQGFVLPLGLFCSASFLFTVLANNQKELQEVVAGDPLNTFVGCPGLKSETSVPVP